MSPEKKARSPKRPASRTTRRKTVRRKPFGEKYIIGFLFSICLLSSVFITVVLGTMVTLKIPDIRTVAHYRPLQTSYIVDRHGNVIERIFIENRTVVPLSKMPELLPKAFVAAEDSRFFEHPGLDFMSVMRAALVNIRRGERSQGGSTITQQVARSLLLTREKTYIRKFKEAILAWRIDSLLSKEDILHIYLNQIYLGAGAYGVEAAAQVYFNKNVQQLSLGEMAVLAGLPQAPSRYSPLNHPEKAISRQKYVLNRMAADGVIDKKTAHRAFEKKLDIYNKPNSSLLDAGYYTEIVKKRARRMISLQQFNEGVRIQTYLDSRLQRAAVKAVRSGVKASFGRQVRNGNFQAKLPQGALVSLEACTSRVRALVGGRNYGESQYNRASMARRQAGSAFKPILFGAALERGWNSRSTIWDGPLSIAGSGNRRWQPQNYSGRYHGEVTLAEALVHSYNTAAVRLLRRVGLKQVHRLSSRLGIHSEMPGDLSLALGSLDVSLLELSSAYSPFICDGKHAPPQFIHRIDTVSGTSLVTSELNKEQVLSVSTAREMRWMLSQVVHFGTGNRAKGIKGESGGKTGTSDDSRDAWFIGYNRGNLTGVWVGNDQNEPMGDDENGGRTAAPIWHDFMENTEVFR